MIKVKSIRSQLFPIFLLITIISVMTLSWYTTRSYKTFHLEQMKSSLVSHAQSLFPFIINNIDSPSKLDSIIKETHKNSIVRITLIKENGEIISDSDKAPHEMENHRDRPEILTALKGQIGYSMRLSTTTGHRMLYVALPDTLTNKYILRISIPISFIKEANKSFSQNILFGVLIIVILTALSIHIFSKKISRPLEEIRKGAEKFSKGNLSSPLILQTPTKETQSLVNTLNNMAADLSEKISTISFESQQSEAILSSMTEGIIAVDTNESINKINNAAVTMFNLSSTEKVKGKQLIETIRISTVYDIFKKTIANNQSINTEIAVSTPSGDRKIIKTIASPWLNFNKEKLGVIFVFEDITRLTRLENLRKDFVANVSHELKTPVTSIKGYIETLIDGAYLDKETLLSFLSTISKQTNRLNSIIEDLLTLSRLEQNAIGQEMVFEPYSINTILRSAIEACNLSAHKKNITISTELDDDCVVEVNQTLIEQSFVNLIDNAIKYSSEDTTINVVTKVQLKEVTISFSDKGMGIARKHLPRLFERFYRVDKARSRKQGGTGLGLSIVKHIANMHNGNVTVSSFPGKGSTFTVSLPKTEKNILTQS